MHINKDNVYSKLNKSQYTTLEKKQIEKIIEELCQLTEQIGLGGDVKMVIDRNRWSRVSIYANGFGSPIFVSANERNLSTALYKVRRLAVNKIRRDAKKNKDFRPKSSIDLVSGSVA